MELNTHTHTHKVVFSFLCRLFLWMQSAELFVLSQQMSGSLKLQPCIHFSTSLLLIVNGTLSSEHCLYTLLQSTESPMDVRNSALDGNSVSNGNKGFFIACAMFSVQCSLWTRLYTTGLNLIIDTTGSSVKQTCWLHNYIFSMIDFLFDAMQFIWRSFVLVLFCVFFNIFAFFIFVFLHF